MSQGMSRDENPAEPAFRLVVDKWTELMSLPDAAGEAPACVAIRSVHDQKVVRAWLANALMFTRDERG